MFRLVLPPIISIWYLSHRYCYLPLSWESWNRFECAVGGVRQSLKIYIMTDGLRTCIRTPNFTVRLDVFSDVIERWSWVCIVDGLIKTSRGVIYWRCSFILGMKPSYSLHYTGFIAVLPAQRGEISPHCCSHQAARLFLGGVSFIYNLWTTLKTEELVTWKWWWRSPRICSVTQGRWKRKLRHYTTKHLGLCFQEQWNLNLGLAAPEMWSRDFGFTNSVEFCFW
jgi:hypothetical protein